METLSAFAELFRRQLELSGVTPDESVVVLSRGESFPRHVDASLAAARGIGATVEHVRIGSAGPDWVGLRTIAVPELFEQPSAVEAMKAADLVVDLVFLLYAPQLHEILAAATRVLTAFDPQENLERLFPDRSLRERVEVAEELINGASEMHITNAAGTDVTYKLNQYGVVTEYGFNDTPGRWDLWPAGFLLTGGDDDGVDGKVVVAPGDALVLPWMQFVREPIEFTIEKGRIVDLRGGVEADVLSEYLAGFNDPDAYGVSHIGWGLNEKASWAALATAPYGSIGMDSRSYYGNVMFSTGPNIELGGNNMTAAHIDLPMRRCDLYLDGEPIIREGKILMEQMQPR
ncbi:2,5-dihydroxypyridine 5,6-dioxygenase [Capillimicrobium parvum]|uniref:2,5-dihydroxypyridine 5,6-dioxygenase n=2 Tax=Capillimicrobium parvum TaxID=2884022 RepID=A0A9E6XYA1_9ACTN|nr:2,5-dihydroxypyridine 5,6-dioxygenase [Capillimicrobium parvum]